MTCVMDGEGAAARGSRRASGAILRLEGSGEARASLDPRGSNSETEVVGCLLGTGNQGAGASGVPKKAVCLCTVTREHLSHLNASTFLLWS